MCTQKLAGSCIAHDQGSRVVGGSSRGPQEQQWHQQGQKANWTYPARFAPRGRGEHQCTGLAQIRLGLRQRVSSVASAAPFRIDSRTVYYLTFQTWPRWGIFWGNCVFCTTTTIELSWHHLVLVSGRSRVVKSYNSSLPFTSGS